MDLGKLWFDLYVETDKDDSEILPLLVADLDGAVRNGAYFIYLNNLITFSKTMNHDKEKFLTDSDPWYYCKYTLDAYPREGATLESQKRLASELVASLEKYVDAVKLVSDL